MKKPITIILLTIAFCVSAQDTIDANAQIVKWKHYDSLASIRYDSIRRGPFRTQYLFSLSPISRKVEKVNGLVLGVGHYRSDLIAKQTVNGINAELSPLGLGALLIWPFALPVKPQIDEVFDQDMPSTCTKVNGLNISVGGFLEGAEMNGLNLSTFTNMNSMNGLSVSPGCLVAHRVNGISISGVVSAAGKLNGLSAALVNISSETTGMQVGGFNFSENVKGLQIGLYNNITQKGSGLQIGLVNRSKSSGLQIGLLNVNNKRALPIINW